MKIGDLIAAREQELAAVTAQRAAFVTEQESLLAGAEADKRQSLNDAEQKRFDELSASKREASAKAVTIEGKLDELRAEKADDDKVARAQEASVPAAPRPQYDEVARVGQEPRTYSRHLDQSGERSFFVDSYRATTGDAAASERLQRHGREAQVERELTARATTTSSYAGLVVPQYLVDLAALAARNGRPLANAVTRLQLPEQGTVFQIPRGTTGAATAIQITENSSVQSTDEVWANLTLNVSTIAGQQDVSRQSLERGTPGLDALIYRDLAGAYAANLDSQIISGSGSSGQLPGIFTAGGTQSTAYGAAVTATTFYLKLAGAINAIESSGTVVSPANLIVMHPRRFSWLLGQVDTQGRPLVVPMSNLQTQNVNTMGADGAPGAYSGNPQAASTGVDFNSYTVKGLLQGIPVITDANVQTAVGSGPEDIVYVMNTDHVLLWENGDGMPQQLKFEQTLGNQLTVKLVVYNYAAFTAGRYPTAVSIIGGNSGAGFGHIAPTF